MTDTPWWHEGDEASSPRGDAFGSAATEAARLFEVVRDRMMTDPNTLRAGMRMMEAFSLLRGGGGHPVQPGDAPECAYCPVCQAISHARNLSPETVERLTGAAMEFAETVRQTVAQDPDSGSEGEGPVRHVPLDDTFDVADTTAAAGATRADTDDDPRADGGPADAGPDDGFLGWPGDDDEDLLGPRPT